MSLTIKIEKIKIANVLAVLVILIFGVCPVLPQKDDHSSTTIQMDREYSLYWAVLSASRLFEKGETYRVIKRCNDSFDSLPYGYDSRYLGYLSSYKGLVYHRTGNYYLSEKCYKLTQYYGYRLEDKDITDPLIINLGSLASVSKEYLKASNYYHKILDSKAHRYSESLNILAKIGMMDLAIREEDVINGQVLFNNLATYSNHNNLSLLELNLGGFQMMLNHPDRALPYFQLASSKSMVNRVKGYYSIGICYDRLGECYSKLGRIDSAIIFFDKAERILTTTTQNDSTGQLEITPQYETVLIECLIKQGGFYAEREESLPTAYEKYMAAINRLLFLSHAITAESSRFIIAEKGRIAFDGGINCALRLFDQTHDNRYLDQAFEWSLQSKSLSLNWLVEKDLVYARVGIPAELTLKLQLYRKTLDEMLGDSLGYAVKVPLDSIGRVIRMYEETENQIRTKYEEIRKGVDEDPILNRISAKTFKKEQYLGYYDLDSVIMVFGITPQGRSCIRIPKDSQLITSIQRYKEILSAPPGGIYGSKEVSAFSELSFYLYEKLVLPALNRTEKGRLAIHPDGILLGFPFEALITAKVTADSFKKLPFLMNRFQTRYLTTSLLIDPDKVPDLHKNLISIITCRNAASIPEVATEVAGISKIFRYSSIRYLDQESQNIFLNDTARIIHISSHLSVNNPDPLKSGVYCSDSDSTGLTFHDILSMQLSGSQVFINACESGNGPVNHGEGLMSLGLAFSIAGCSGIIQQLWKAPDHSSSLIAQSYYKYLRKSGSAKAIARAKKEYLRSAKTGADHPYNWAGIVCYTNIPGKANSPRIFIFILILMISGAGAYWFLRKRN